MEETWIDKTEWGDGPWQDEPDRIEWRIDELLKAIAIVKSYRWETQYINGTALSPQDTETKETVDGSP